MRTVTKYISDDGHTFDEMADCLAHEAACRDRARRLAGLLAPPVDRNDGNSFVQQDKTTVLELQRWAVGHIERASQRKFPEAYAAEVPIGLTIVGRIADDCGPAFVRPVMFRIQCMDSKFREWGQPYFALQADKLRL